MARSRWHSCNVLQSGADKRIVWRFDPRKDSIVPADEKIIEPGKPLPLAMVGKDWSSLVQKKLNLALLSPEHVFLRVIHLPVTTADEIVAMVEFQLEKLSPLPLAQIVWTLHIMPQVVDNQQAVVVVIAAREQVEAFLGTLETEGFQCDRLDVLMLGQIDATPAKEDGVWIYPETIGGKHSALVAWWGNGLLRHLGLIGAPPGSDRARTLGGQLTQMAWAGEMEGWMSGTPQVHLVAGPELADEWEPLLREGLGMPVQTQPPLPVRDLAGHAVRRAVAEHVKVALLPSEYGVRYQQSLVDRLWMRGVGAVIMLYIFGVLVYFGFLNVQTLRADSVGDDIKSISKTYTNALQVKALYLVLQERQDLKYAVLNCWKAVAEHCPADHVLNQFDFSDGRKLTLNGTATDAAALLDFDEKLRKYQADGQLLFGKVSVPDQRKNATGAIDWTIICELNRGDSVK